MSTKTAIEWTEQTWNPSTAGKYIRGRNHVDSEQLRAVGEIIAHCSITIWFIRGKNRRSDFGIAQGAAPTLSQCAYSTCIPTGSTALLFLRSGVGWSTANIPIKPAGKGDYE